MSILRTTLAAALFASLSAPTLAAENDPVVVSGSDDPVIVSGVEARVAQPIFALRPDKWTRQLGPAGGYYPEKAARPGQKIVSGQAAIECTLVASARLTDCKLLSETPEEYAFGDAALRMAEKGALLAAPRLVNGERMASERIRMVVPFTPPAKP